MSIVYLLYEVWSELLKKEGYIEDYVGEYVSDYSGGC